jgi:hypothetical protein
VQRVGQVPPDLGVAQVDRLDLLGRVPAEEIRRGRLRRQLPGLPLRHPVAERPRQLARPGRGGRAGLSQYGLGGLEQLGTAVDQLDLPLTPGRGLLAVDRRGDVVVADLGQHLALGVDQPVHDPPGRERHHRHEVVVADVHPDRALDLDRHVADRAAERVLDLQPSARGRQLDVPAVVLTAGPAAQCHLVRREAQIRGVEVDRLQGELDRLLDADDSRQLVQRRHDRVLVDVVLGLDLELLGRRHPPCLPVGSSLVSDSAKIVQQAVAIAIRQA